MHTNREIPLLDLAELGEIDAVIQRLLVAVLHADDVRLAHWSQQDRIHIGVHAAFPE